MILNFVKKSDSLPDVNSAFFKNRGSKGDFSVSNQIAEFGIKLLGDIEELYVPFTNDFAYAYYTDSKIFAEHHFKNIQLIAELINILDNKDIEFKLSNPLEKPSFINPDAPHLLREFDTA